MIEAGLKRRTKLGLIELRSQARLGDMNDWRDDHVMRNLAVSDSALMQPTVHDASEHADQTQYHHCCCDHRCMFT